MAQCIDARREKFGHGDRLLLDTNVIVDVASLFPGMTAHRRAYIDFVVRAEQSGAKFFVSTLSFFEAAGTIEKLVVNAALGREPTREEVKRQRADATSRAEFLDRLRRFWNQVMALAEPIEASVPPGAIEGALDLLGKTRLDGYDPLLVFAAKQHGISTIVTHDADFATVPDLIVVTANEKMLS